MQKAAELGRCSLPLGVLRGAPTLRYPRASLASCSHFAYLRAT